MARLKIVWTETATIVLRRILTFYRVRNGNSKYSRSIYTMINDVLKLVAKYPYIYTKLLLCLIYVFFIVITLRYIIECLKNIFLWKLFLILAKILIKPLFKNLSFLSV